MSILDGIKSLFGSGKVVYEVTFTDGSSGRAKIGYVGSLQTLSHANSILKIEDETGKRVRTWEYLGTL